MTPPFAWPAPPHGHHRCAPRPVAPRLSWWRRWCRWCRWIDVEGGRG